MEQTGVTHVRKHFGTEGSLIGSCNFHKDVPKSVFHIQIDIMVALA